MMRIIWCVNLRCVPSRSDCCARSYGCVLHVVAAPCVVIQQASFERNFVAMLAFENVEGESESCHDAM